MTDIKLPAGYEDWVEVDYPGADSERLRVLIDHFPGNIFGSGRQTLWFVPPTPKPTLPDVKPGAVLRYKDKSGIDNRAVMRCEDAWEVHAMISGKIYRFDYDNSEMLADVNADGFTVELEGL